MWRFPEQLRTGKRFQEALLTGAFDESPVDRVFADWFAARPERAEQRAIFVQLTTGLGCAKPIVADRLLTCIGKAMGGKGQQFGDLLAQELDRLIEAPRSTAPSQREGQRAALEAFVSIKTGLRSLDYEGLEGVHQEIRDAYIADGLPSDAAERIASYLVEMFSHMREHKDPQLANIVLTSTMTVFRQRLYNDEAYAGRFAARLQMDGIRDACLVYDAPVAESADIMYAAVVAGYEAYSGDPDATG